MYLELADTQHKGNSGVGTCERLRGRPHVPGTG